LFLCGRSYLKGNGGFVLAVIYTAIPDPPTGDFLRRVSEEGLQTAFDLVMSAILMGRKYYEATYCPEVL
jgi:hypothetical protein